MKVLVVGSGGREHAIAWKISQSPLVTEIFCAPGNPGTRRIAHNVEISATDVDGLVAWARETQIDLTVVGPEAPLALGVVDAFRAVGLRIFGPTREAARLESSKAFAKEIMNAAQVRTPKGETFDDFEKAKRYVEQSKTLLVVKADGLAAGKGVVVPENKEETIAALHEFLVKGKLGASSSRVVLEERIVGREASVMALIDGVSALPLLVSQDYKRINDGDLGPNTGGMGAISPTPVLGDAEAEVIVREMFVPVLKELERRGVRYTGFLYGGMMIDSAGVPSIIEFNCRLGDPETEVLLLRLESDLVETIIKACDSKLEGVNLSWRKEAAACVVASSKGYPESPQFGDLVHGLFDGDETLQLFHAGTKLGSGAASEHVYTNGGRVLCVSALGGDVAQAVGRAYGALENVSFAGMHYRRDIGRVR